MGCTDLFDVFKYGNLQVLYIRHENQLFTLFIIKNIRRLVIKISIRH